MNRQLTWPAAAAIAAIVLFPPVSLAQYVESEPNDPCTAALDLGALSSLPATVSGNLDPTNDVDFFRFNATPGIRLRTDLRGAASGAGTLADPFLGLFSGQCELLAYNDDSLTLDSRIDFVVSESGQFVLAATGLGDWSFVGDHFQVGSYSLEISILPEPIAAILGRVVDAVSGEPLPGSAPTHGWAALMRHYPDDNLWVYLGDQYTDNYGGFSFMTDWSGNPLEPGEYQVSVTAEEHGSTLVDPFSVTSGESYDLGDIPVQPLSFVFEDISPCKDIPTDGGSCRYSVDIRNNTEATVKGLGWSLVSAWGGTSPVGASLFQAEKVNKVRLPGYSRQTLRFSFDVPSGVAEGTTMCPDVWFSDRETGFFGTLRSRPLFCVMKEYGALRIVDPKTAAAKLGVGNVGLSPHGPQNRRP